MVKGGWSPHGNKDYPSTSRKQKTLLRANGDKVLLAYLYFQIKTNIKHSVFNRLWILCPFALSQLEKEMATHSSNLAWKIPWTEEPGRLQSMGSLRVGHDWATSLSLFTFLHWRGKWQPTPVFLPGESQGRGSLVGCRLWSRTESDTTEAT